MKRQATILIVVVVCALAISLTLCLAQTAITKAQQVVPEVPVVLGGTTSCDGICFDGWFTAQFTPQNEQTANWSWTQGAAELQFLYLCISSHPGLNEEQVANGKLCDTLYSTLADKNSPAGTFHALGGAPYYLYLRFRGSQPGQPSEATAIITFYGFNAPGDVGDNSCDNAIFSIPNSAWGNALYGNLESPFDVDWHSITASQDGQMNLMLSVLDKSTYKLEVRSDDCGTVVTKSENTTPNDVRLTFPVKQGGQYRVKVSGFDQNNYGAPYIESVSYGAGKLNNTCREGGSSPLALGQQAFGWFDFSGAQYWRAVEASQNGMMLFALHDAGPADGGVDDAKSKNFDLGVYDEQCKLVALSRSSKPVLWTNGSLPMKGDERIMVNVTNVTNVTNGKIFNVRVFGATAEDYVFPSVSGNSDYQEIVSYPNLISNKQFAAKVVYEWTDRTPTTNAPGGTHNIIAEFTNNSGRNWQDLTFAVDESQSTQGIVLLNGVTAGTPSVTSLAVPNHELCEPGYPSYLCQLDSDNKVGYNWFRALFQIGMPNKDMKKFQFYVDLYGNQVGNSTPGGTIGTSSSGNDGFRFDVTQDELAETTALFSLYMPILNK